MGVFDSFRKKKPEESSGDVRSETPPKREQPAAGKWQVGDRILNRYEIRDIKWGGMGIVYIALDHQWNHMFAIKTFQDKYLWNEDAIDRFMSEAETWVNLERHTNIVFANFMQRIGGKPCIFLEYIEGGDLSQYIGKVDIPHALDFATQFCNGMDYAYKQLGVIHRDIKPHNAIVTADGVLKVTDFGLAKAVGQRIRREELERGDIAISRGMGTWPYMPPEQFPEEIQKRFQFKPKPMSPRSDIYSFGITFYQVLTGRLPFATAEHIFTENPVKPADLNRYVPKRLDSLLMKCLEKDPHDRHESFEELTRELIEIYHTLPREHRVFGERYVVKGKKETLTAVDWGNKGTALRVLGRNQEAIACYNMALEIDLRLAVVWNNKGSALQELGRCQEAVACYDKALEIDPRKAVAWDNKGTALRVLGRNQEAIACYDRALEIDPREASAWNNKGSALEGLGRHEEAMACYDRALEIEPKDAAAWSNKGTALGLLRRYEEAIACYDKALEIDPRLAVVWDNKGTALRVLGRNQEVIACCDRALEIDPRLAVVWYNKGAALRDLGRNQEVIACCDRALEIDPRLADAWYNKGYALDQLGRRREALPFYDRALEIDPRLAAAWFGKGVILAELGRDQEAIVCLQKWIELAPRQHASEVKAAEELVRFLKGKR